MAGSIPQGGYWSQNCFMCLVLSWTRGWSLLVLWVYSPIPGVWLLSLGLTPHLCSHEWLWWSLHLGWFGVIGVRELKMCCGGITARANPYRQELLSAACVVPRALTCRGTSQLTHRQPRGCGPAWRPHGLGLPHPWPSPALWVCSAWKRDASGRTYCYPQLPARRVWRRWIQPLL